jgi:hypothetical protein
MSKSLGKKNKIKYNNNKSVREARVCVGEGGVCSVRIGAKLVVIN